MTGEGGEEDYGCTAPRASGRLAEEGSDPVHSTPSVATGDADNNMPYELRPEVRHDRQVVSLAGMFWSDAKHAAAECNGDPWNILCDIFEFVANRQGKPRLGPAEWMRWVSGTPGARSLQDTQESMRLSEETLPSGTAEGTDFGRPCDKPAKPWGRVAHREKRRRSARKRWDYNATVDSIIYSLCEEMGEYAEVYQVEAADLVKDVFQLIMLEAPALARPDKDYAEGIATIRDWFLADVEALARSFDLAPLDVLEDVFHVVISDEVLPRDRAEELGSRITVETSGQCVPSA